MKSKFQIPKVPAAVAQFVLRIPLSIIFLQQGFSKLPVNEVNQFGLPLFVWWFVTFAEIGSGIGIVIGGLMGFKYFIGLGDLITRFSGITMACVMTGVIWLSAPPDLMTVLRYHYLDVSLYCLAIYFALQGNSSKSPAVAESPTAN
jgi:uncharacterized membrane protein YphA (DoxX/SURF4 family)